MTKRAFENFHEILAQNGHVDPQPIEPETKRGFLGQRVNDEDGPVNQIQNDYQLSPADAAFAKANADLPPEEYMKQVVSYVHTQRQMAYTDDDSYNYTDAAADPAYGDCVQYSAQMAQLLRAGPFSPEQIAILEGDYVFELEGGQTFFGGHVMTLVDHNGQTYVMDNNLDEPVIMNGDKSMNGAMSGEKPEYEGQSVTITAYTPYNFVPLEGQALFTQNRDFDLDQNVENTIRLRDEVIPYANQEATVEDIPSNETHTEPAAEQTVDIEQTRIIQNEESTPQLAQPS